MESERVINLKTTDTDRIRCFVEILNTIFHLTKSEMDVLVAFIAYDRIEPCSTQARKDIKELLNINSIEAVNNYVKSLKDKKAIIATGRRGYRYHSLLQYDPKVDRIVINIKQVVEV